MKERKRETRFYDWDEENRMIQIKIASYIALKWQTISKRSESLLQIRPFSGEHGIRTHDAFRHTAFREPHLKPLGQLSELSSDLSILSEKDGKCNPSYQKNSSFEMQTFIVKNQ